MGFLFVVQRSFVVVSKQSIKVNIAGSSGLSLHRHDRKFKYARAFHHSCLAAAASAAQVARAVLAQTSAQTAAQNANPIDA